MTDADRAKLLFGPYEPPHFRLGEVVTDEARDCDVVIVSMTDIRIPWPIGKQKPAAVAALSSMASWSKTCAGNRIKPSATGGGSLARP